VSRKTTVLLVEDDLPVSQALGHALASENYAIVPAANSREALKGFAEHSIDVALLDLNLGKENGWDIYQRLASLRPQLPIFVMSATPDQFPCPLASAPAVLEKPLDLPFLFKKLSALSTTRTGQERGGDGSSLSSVDRPSLSPWHDPKNPQDSTETI